MQDSSSVPVPSFSHFHTLHLFYSLGLLALHVCDPFYVVLCLFLTFSISGGFPGGQAEYVRVPIGSVNLLPIPEGLSDEQVIYLSDVLPTSYHCVVDTGVKEGDVVGIWVRIHASRPLSPSFSLIDFDLCRASAQ